MAKGSHPTQGKTNHSRNRISRVKSQIQYLGEGSNPQTQEISLLLHSGFCHLANTRVLAK